jgi:hypothetical protein
MTHRLLQYFLREELRDRVYPPCLAESAEELGDRSVVGPALLLFKTLRGPPAEVLAWFLISKIMRRHSWVNSL